MAEEALGRTVRRHRERREMSVADLARASGLPASRVEGIERGERLVRFSDLLALADGLGLTTPELVAEAEGESPPAG